MLTVFIESSNTRSPFPSHSLLIRLWPSLTFVCHNSFPLSNVPRAVSLFHSTNSVTTSAHPSLPLLLPLPDHPRHDSSYRHRTRVPQTQLLPGYHPRVRETCATMTAHPVVRLHGMAFAALPRLPHALRLQFCYHLQFAPNRVPSILVMEAGLNPK